MKKPLFTCLLFFIFISLHPAVLISQNIVVIDDFESGLKSWLGIGCEFEIVNNPHKTSQNASDKVLKCIRKTNSVNYAGAILSGVYNIPVGAADSDFGTAKMKVLKSTDGNVGFKIEKGPSNSFYESNSAYQPTGDWVDVSFDLKPATSGNYLSYFFMIDRTNSITEDIIVYIDDIELIRNVEAAITPTVPDAGGSGETDGYKLIWHDSFNSDLDEAFNWTIEERGDGGGNNELQYYRRDNIAVGQEPETGKNCLVITAKKENYMGKNATSGRLTTQYKVALKYGKAEASIKMPKTANGLWPAFWLLGADINVNNWPASGEIDIMEMGDVVGINNNVQDRYFSGACHWASDVDGSHRYYGRPTTNSYGLQDDFHLFTMIWDADNIKFYLDLDKYPTANPYYTLPISGNSSATKPDNYFHKQYFLILNLAVGGDFPNIWDINGVTALNNGDAKMYVDFVKVYQKGDEGEEFNGPHQEIASGLNQSVSKETIDIYPNPAKDYLKFASDAGIVKAEISNITGQNVMKSQINNNFIDISSLPSGQYIIALESSTGRIFTQKFMKM